MNRNVIKLISLFFAYTLAFALPTESVHAAGNWTPKPKKESGKKGTPGKRKPAKQSAASSVGAGAGSIATGAGAQPTGEGKEAAAWPPASGSRGTKRIGDPLPLGFVTGDKRRRDETPVVEHKDQPESSLLDVWEERYLSENKIAYDTKEAKGQPPAAGLGVPGEETKDEATGAGIGAGAGISATSRLLSSSDSHAVAASAFASAASVSSSSSSAPDAAPAPGAGALPTPVLTVSPFALTGPAHVASGFSALAFTMPRDRSARANQTKKPKGKKKKKPIDSGVGLVRTAIGTGLGALPSLVSFSPTLLPVADRSTEEDHVTRVLIEAFTNEIMRLRVEQDIRTADEPLSKEAKDQEDKDLREATARLEALSAEKERRVRVDAFSTGASGAGAGGTGAFVAGAWGAEVSPDYNTLALLTMRGQSERPTSAEKAQQQKLKSKRPSYDAFGIPADSGSTEQEAAKEQELMNKMSQLKINKFLLAALVVAVISHQTEQEQRVLPTMSPSDPALVDLALAKTRPQSMPTPALGAPDASSGSEGKEPMDEQKRATRAVGAGAGTGAGTRASMGARAGATSSRGPSELTPDEVRKQVTAASLAWLGECNLETDVWPPLTSSELKAAQQKHCQKRKVGPTPCSGDLDIRRESDEQRRYRERLEARAQSVLEGKILDVSVRRPEVFDSRSGSGSSSSSGISGLAAVNPASEDFDDSIYFTPEEMAKIAENAVAATIEAPEAAVPPSFSPEQLRAQILADPIALAALQKKATESGKTLDMVIDEFIAGGLPATPMR